MAKVIAERFLIHNGDTVKPGTEIEVPKKENADRLLKLGYASKPQPKKAKQEQLGEQSGQDELDIANVESMTHEQLDAISGQLEIPEDVYPKSANRDEKIESIQEFAEQNDLLK